jgi:hypothetical protein
VDGLAAHMGDFIMTYRIELSAQGGKAFAYHSRETLMQAHDLANRLRKRHPTITITVEESNNG